MSVPILVLLLLFCLGGIRVMAATPEQAPGPLPQADGQTNGVVAQVSFADQADLNQLAQRLDIWEVDHRSHTFTAQLSAPEVIRLRKQGYTVTVDPVQSSQLNRPLTRLPGQSQGVPGYACYRTVDESHADMSQLAQEYPNLVQVVKAGASWEKVNLGPSSGDDILALVMTNRAIPGPKPAFVLIAAIHAREMATAELALRFAEQTVRGYGVDPDATWLLDHTELHVLPLTNPDGRRWAEQGFWWRKNTDQDDGCTQSPTYNGWGWGVDLNRNSSFKWNQGGSSGVACDLTYRGPNAASEPEVQAVENYVRTVIPDQRGLLDEDAAPSNAQGLFITLHSYGSQVLYPWGYTGTPAPNDAGLRTLGRKFGYFNRYDVCQAGEPACIYATSGTTDDWAYGELGAPAYTFEVGTTFFQSCDYFERTLLPQNLPALGYALKAARQPYQEPLGPDLLQVAAQPMTVTAGITVTLTGVADDTRYFSNGYGNEPTQPITLVQYSVDQPPWASPTITGVMTATDGLFNTASEGVSAALNTADWSPGRHMIFVRGQDGAGNWGPPSASFVTVVPAQQVALIAQSYFSATLTQGQTITYHLPITNIGSIQDAYTVTTLYTGTAQVTLGELPSVLAVGEQALLSVTVALPLTATVGSHHTVTVIVQSHTDPSQSVSIFLETTVTPRFLPTYLPIFIRPSLVQEPIP